VIDQGRRLLAAQQEQEAHNFLKEAVERFPDDPELRVLYASILAAFQPEDAAVEVATAVELSSDDPVILVRAAHLMLDRREFEAARSFAARANEAAEPGFVLMSGLINLNGRLAALNGEDELAEEKFRSAIECDPSFAAFSMDLAKFLTFRNRKSEALAVLDEAIEQGKYTDDLERLRVKIVNYEPDS
jgi:Flp pilus assembly protein TadD